MRPSEQHPVNDNEPPKQRRDYALFFFEQQDNRSFFRFTPLGVTVIVLITVVPVILILIYTVISTSRISNMNVNANVMSTPNPTNRPVIIQQPTPVRVQPKIIQPRMSVPNPLNDPVIIKRSESPTPSRSPTPQNSNRSANHQ
jgi:hypothetical protein